MGLIGSFVFWVLVAVVGTVLAVEAQAWAPKATDFLIRFAVGKLPEEKRERYLEEWSNYIDETPGSLGKFFQATGFLIAAEKTKWITKRIGRIKHFVVIDNKKIEATSLVGSFVADFVDSIKLIIGIYILSLIVGRLLDDILDAIHRQKANSKVVPSKQAIEMSDAKIDPFTLFYEDEGT